MAMATATIRIHVISIIIVVVLGCTAEHSVIPSAQTVVVVKYRGVPHPQTRLPQQR